ncbi:hypothetical protein KAU33_01205, partial [Candidatus Dependentiae bacterium]|nr:hypothetical protein [Candidatus Dependentiae bacterium]
MRKFLLFIFFFILIFLHVYSYDQIHPIFIDAPLIDGINITCENILTTNDSLTDLYLWDLNTRDIISDNYPIQLNGALISLPLIQKIGDGGLNYITYCIQDNSGIIYFNVVDYLGNQHPLFPKRLMAKPTSTPIVREIDNETQMIFGTDSGEIIILDISEDMDENNYISIQTPGTNSVVNLIDLNNDNDDEIIVSVKTYATQYKIKYYEYNIDTWEENTNQITFNGLITSNLIFKDLDSDGNPEIIFGSDNGNINIYSGFGGYSAYGTYPQNVSSLEIINLQDFTGDSIIAFDNEKSGFKVNMNIFSTEILISGQDSNLYSTLPLISPYKTFDYAIFTSFNGSDLRLKYSTGRIEEWGYFNHFIKRSVNNTVIQIQTTSPINVSNIISDTVPLEIVVGTNNYDDPNLGEIYWCGYLIDDRKNTIEPIPVESSYKYNNNRFIGYYNYVGIYGDILQIPKSMLTPGTYKVLVAAIDGKGGYNIEIKEFEFTYEDTFFIEITRPFADQILDGELQLIQEVHGTARYMTGFTNFVFYYMLTYSTIENPGTRTTIAGGTEQFTDIKIADWNISALASGKYMLYLTANIRNLTLNETDEFSQPIIIDNEHPTAIILNLFEEKVITGRYNILGVADDPNFTGYNLKIKPYDSNIWIPLTETIYESKQNEVLHCLNTSNFDDGLYNVKLTVSDIAGKTTDFTVRDIHILNSLDNIVLESSLDTFSPNEDICNDYTVFTFSEDNISVPLIGDIFIRDENGLTVRTINVPDTNSSYVWDGKDDLGVYLPEGLYICSAVFNDTGTGTYYSNEKFISIAFNDEIVEFYAEDTLNYEYWVYLMQPDKHPVENKMLYIRGGSHCGCGLGCQSYPCRLP